MKKAIWLSLMVAAMIIVFLSIVSGCGSKPLTIEGFHLGMPLDEAKFETVRLFRDAGIPIQPLNEQPMFDAFFLEVRDVGSGNTLMSFGTDSWKRITRFSFNPETLDRLFGTSGMDDGAIAKKFMSDFRLPPLESIGPKGWEYLEMRDMLVRLRISVLSRHFIVEGILDSPDPKNLKIN